MRSILFALGQKLTFIVSMLAMLGLAAASIVASVPAASAAVRAAGHPAARAAARPDNQVTVPRAMADMATARREHRTVEITADQTAYSQTVANPDGTLTTSVSQQPRWAKRGASWVTASADLARDR